MTTPALTSCPPSVGSPCILGVPHAAWPSKRITAPPFLPSASRCCKDEEIDHHHRENSLHLAQARGLTRPHTYLHMHELSGQWRAELARGICLGSLWNTTPFLPSFFFLPLPSSPDVRSNAADGQTYQSGRLGKKQQPAVTLRERGTLPDVSARRRQSHHIRRRLDHALQCRATRKNPCVSLVDGWSPQSCHSPVRQVLQIPAAQSRFRRPPFAMT